MKAFKALWASAFAALILAAAPAVAQQIPDSAYYATGEYAKTSPVYCVGGCAAPVPFAPTGNTTLAATTSSARVALPSADTTVVVQNTGSVAAYLKLGNGSVTAATTDFLLPAGQVAVLSAGANVDLAAITSSGAVTLNIATGTGTPTFGPTGLISNSSFQSEGKAAAQATVAGNPILNGCRSATAVPTASADGQVQYVLCGVEGKQVFLPFAIKELMVRGAASSTDTSAHQLFAAAGASVKNYATDLECTNSSATDSDITLNDSSSFSLTLKAGSGFMKSFQVPLVTAANTALNFTMGTGVSTVKCNAQGYTGP